MKLAQLKVILIREGDLKKAEKFQSMNTAMQHRPGTIRVAAWDASA